MDKEYIIEAPPNKKKINFEKFSHKNWDFYSHIEYMMSSKIMDELTSTSDYIQIKLLPEVLNGYNRLFLINKDNNFAYEFSPLKILDLTNFEIRKKAFENKSIYYIPPEVKVQFHDEWKDIKVEGKEEIKEQESISDWTFCSPSMGNICTIPNSEIANFYEEEKLDKDKIFKTEIDDKISIPIEKLTPQNPIIHYSEVIFYEDELGDNGICESKIRFRIMNDCFYGLMRAYLRVDNVLIRNMDTRIFHNFGDDYIIRQFTVKEMSYMDLKRMGFNFSNEWNISPYQSDQVDQYMKSPIFCVKDKLYIK